MYKLPSTLVATALLSGLAGGGLAQETGGVRISGSAHNATRVGGSVNIASGHGARAVTSVGSIGDGVTVRGNLSMSVSVDEIMNVADDAGEEATTHVGVVEEDTEVTGRREVVISTGRIVNMADGRDGPSCVIVGSTGAPGC